MSLRTILTDNLWKRLAYLLDRTGRVYNKSHRNTVEEILYRIRTGCPWRDLPLNLACGTGFIAGNDLLYSPGEIDVWLESKLESSTVPNN